MRRKQAFFRSSSNKLLEVHYSSSYLPGTLGSDIVRSVPILLSTCLHSVYPYGLRRSGVDIDVENFSKEPEALLLLDYFFGASCWLRHPCTRNRSIWDVCSVECECEHQSLAEFPNITFIMFVRKEHYAFDMHADSVSSAWAIAKPYRCARRGHFSAMMFSFFYVDWGCKW